MRRLPYGRQWISEEDIAAVVEVLRSDWLTTGPQVDAFEKAFAQTVGSGEAVAVSSGTAALHAAIYSLGITPGDEVIVPALTFAATANCVAFLGGCPVFADVDTHTLLMDLSDVRKKISNRTKAVIAVDYAGQPCDYDALRLIAHEHGLTVVADACHSLGGSYRGRSVGTLADLNAFSFHPVKHITTGEGGMVTTDDPRLAQRMRRFRNHGITTDHRQRETQESWFYEMVDLGFNYRLSDIQCALGLSQLKKLPGWVARRQSIAEFYTSAFSELAQISPLKAESDRTSAWHLYVIKLDLTQLTVGRDVIFRALRAENIGVNVHYVPVPWHPYYRRLGYTPGNWPRAEAAYEQVLSLPMWPGMTDSDAERVVETVTRIVRSFRHS